MVNYNADGFKNNGFNGGCIRTSNAIKVDGRLSDYLY